MLTQEQSGLSLLKNSPTLNGTNTLEKNHMYDVEVWIDQLSIKERVVHQRNYYRKQEQTSETRTIVSLLTTLLGDIENKEKTSAKDVDVIAQELIQSYIKRNNQSVEIMKYDTDELRLERKTLMSFLPKQMTENDILKIIKDQYHVTFHGVNDFMKFMNSTRRGLFDNAVAKKLFDEYTTRHFVEHGHVIS